MFGVPAVVMTLAMNGVLEGLTLGLSGGLDLPVLRRLRAAAVAGGRARHAAGMPVDPAPVARGHRGRRRSC